MRILIADSDPSLRTLVGMRLSTRGYSVTEVESGEEALRFLEREKVDLVLLSSEMKAPGGKFLSEKIREMPPLATLPIILLTDEEKISELVTSQDRGFDDFLTEPFNPLVLQLRVAMNISRAKQRIEANALTHLPGNHAIERLIRAKIDRLEKFTVLYIDINHFKSFNDAYGFGKGDDVIRQTAKILLQTAEAMTPESPAFVGHIGGDDFVVVIDCEREEAYARHFIMEFDRIIPTYYNATDQKRGFIRTTSRQGKRETFPVMSCSAAAVTSLYRDYKNLGEIARDAAEVKSFLKSQAGSHYLRDRRSAPIQVLADAVKILHPEVEAVKAAELVDPLGQVLLDAGLINEEELGAALKKHLETGQRLGQVLIGMNVVRSEDVGRMLEKKLNVPYVSLRQNAPSREAQRILTLEFIKSHRVVALSKEKGTIKLGMCDPFDLKTLDMIERITQLKPIPLLALEDEFEAFLERYEAEIRGEEKVG